MSVKPDWPCMMYTLAQKVVHRTYGDNFSLTFTVAQQGHFGIKSTAAQWA